MDRELKYVTMEIGSDRRVGSDPKGSDPFVTCEF